MPYSLIADIQKEMHTKEKFYNAHSKAIEELNRLEPVWDAFMPHKVNRHSAMLLSIYTENMKDVEPLLALLSHDELSFTDTGDKYAANRNRDFQRSDGVMVCVYVTGETCRKEQIGEEVVPVYKLACE